MTTPTNRRIGPTPIIDVTATTTTPATTTPANTTTGTPVTSSRSVLKKKYWIPALLLLLLVAAMITTHYWTKPKMPQASQDRSGEVAMMKMQLQLEELKKLSAEAAAKSASLSPLAPATPTTPTTPIAPATPAVVAPAALSDIERERATQVTPAPEIGIKREVAVVEKYARRDGGTLIRHCSKQPVFKGGKKYYYLYNHPTLPKQMPTEPVTRSIAAIAENMTFESSSAIPPEKGRLAVFDTRLDPQTNQLVNIFAWEVIR